MDHEFDWDEYDEDEYYAELDEDWEDEEFGWDEEDPGRPETEYKFDRYSYSNFDIMDEDDYWNEF